MPIEASTVPVTEKHLKIMADKLFNAMVGLWQIINDHGTDAMKKWRDDHLTSLGIQMGTPEGVNCVCPRCMANADSPIAKTQRVVDAAVAKHVSEGGEITEEMLAQIPIGGKFDA